MHGVTAVSPDKHLSDRLQHCGETRWEMKHETRTYPLMAGAVFTSSSLPHTGLHLTSNATPVTTAIWWSKGTKSMQGMQPIVHSGPREATRVARPPRFGLIDFEMKAFDRSTIRGWKEMWVWVSPEMTPLCRTATLSTSWVFLNFLTSALVTAVHDTIQDLPRTDGIRENWNNYQ